MTYRERYAKAVRDHPEGGWGNPLWRAMAVADIVVMVGIVVLLVAIVLVVT
jgi:lipoprotein signal peptidase